MKQKMKRFGIFLIFALPLLYFMFTIVFFNPFEEPFDRIDFIIPREVDYFVSKAGLKHDFDDFPIPRFYEKMTINREWRAFTETDNCRELGARLKLDRLVDKVRYNMEQVSFIDPLADVVGEELVVAGNFKDEGDQPLSYLVFFRGSWKVKLAFELATWDFIRGFAGDPLISESHVIPDPDGYVTLVLEDGQEFYLRRVSDLIVFGDDEALMREVCGLINMEKSAIDLSLGGSSAFRNKISPLMRVETGYVDFHANLEHVFQRSTFDEEWKANEIDFSVMTAVDIFDPDFFKTITGALKLGTYLDIDAQIDFHTEAVANAETGFFGRDSIQIENKLDFLVSMLPTDVFFAGVARMDLEPVLKTMDRNLDADTKKLVTDFIREGRRFNRQWNVSGMWDFIEKLDQTFSETVYLAMRPRDVDKPLLPGIQPLPILALILEINDMESYATIEKTVVEMQSNNKTSYEMWQYKSMIHGCRIKGINTAGTDDIEQIAYTVLDDRYFIVATSSSFIQDILKARANLVESLKKTDKYQPAAEFIEGHGNLAVYLDVKSLKGELTNYAVYWAEINSRVDFKTERPAARQRIIQREHPQYVGKDKLPPAVEKQVEDWVEAEMERLRQELNDEEIPELTAQFRKHLDWIDLLDSLCLKVNVDLNDLDVGIRVSSMFSRKR